MRPISWATADDKMICYYLSQVLVEVMYPPRRASIVEISHQAFKTLLRATDPTSVKKQMKRYGEAIANMTNEQ